MKKPTAKRATYFVYILECADGTLYTGSTNDLDKRLTAHNSATGPMAAKYTRSRRPVTMRYSETCKNKSAALKREWVLKKLSRNEKLTLIET
jgi:putative endonuclease